MNGREDAIGPGRPPRGRRVGAFAASAVLLLALPLGAGDVTTGLTPQSSWTEILSKAAIRPPTLWQPYIQVQFPYLFFGKTSVSMADVCLDGDMLRIANPSIDKGVRVPAANFPGQLTTRRGTTGTGPFAAVHGALSDRQPGVPLRYQVSVYKVIETGVSSQRVLLFEKPWEVPTCSTP